MVNSKSRGSKNVAKRNIAAANHSKKRDVKRNLKPELDREAIYEGSLSPQEVATMSDGNGENKPIDSTS